jgi:uncharacterized damage-inducible protein DinB
MPANIQSHLAKVTNKAAKDLVTAYLALPEEKRDWKPAETSRSALDQVAECAVANDMAIKLLQTRVFSQELYGSFMQEKAAAQALEWEQLHALLEESTGRFVAYMEAIPDSDLDIELDLPWGKSTIAEILSYTQWNLAYHQGQINYIASLLGTL